MFKHKFFAAERIFEVSPHGNLSAEDFSDLQEIIRQERSHGRSPRGIVAIVEQFPEWKDLDALEAHIGFIRDNHEFFKRIAIVTDDVTLPILVEKCIAPLIRCEVRFFSAKQQLDAEKWSAGATK